MPQLTSSKLSGVHVKQETKKNMSISALQTLLAPLFFLNYETNNNKKILNLVVESRYFTRGAMMQYSSHFLASNVLKRCFGQHTTMFTDCHAMKGNK